MVRSVLGYSSAAALMFSPVIAQAQDCDMLRAQMGGATGDLLGIAQDYPRTHIAIVSCMMSYDTDNDRKACAAAIVIGACIGMGSEQCDDLTSRWEKVGRIYQRISTRMSLLGCRR